MKTITNNTQTSTQLVDKYSDWINSKKIHGTVQQTQKLSPAVPVSPRQQTPIPPQVTAAAETGNVSKLSAEERAADALDFGILLKNKDFLALAHHWTYLGMLLNNHKKDVLNRLRDAIVLIHRNDANQNEVKQALNNIDGTLRIYERDKDKPWLQHQT